MVRVLIPTYPGDIHATAVAVALTRKGHEPVLWYSGDFPTRQRASLEISQDAHGWSASGSELDETSSHFDVVWFRRPTAPTLPHDLHPGDRKIAERACVAFYRAFWRLVAPDAFWVNSLSSHPVSDVKPLQLIEAKRVGFRIPPTLCSNDPERIRRFLGEHQGATIYKPFVPAQWETEQGVAHLFTSDIGIDDLPMTRCSRSRPASSYRAL